MGIGWKEISRASWTTVLVIMLLHGLWACAKPPATKAGVPRPQAGAVRFTLFEPGAQQVFLVGSFNGWAKHATPMKIVDGSSLWSVDVPLSEGEHTSM